MIRMSWPTLAIAAFVALPSYAQEPDVTSAWEEADEEDLPEAGAPASEAEPSGAEAPAPPSSAVGEDGSGASAAGADVSADVPPPSREGFSFAPAGGFFGGGMFGLGLGVAPRLDAVLTHGRPFGVSASGGSGDGSKGFAGGARLQLAYQIPMPRSMTADSPALAWLDRLIGIEAEVGYALTATNGTVSFDQWESTSEGPAVVTTTYEYGGLLHQVPLSAGLRGRLPVFLFLPGLYLDASAGFEGVLGISTVEATVEGAPAPFTTGNSASGFAWGFYAEGGVAFGVGPGEVTAAYRYSSAYLDFGHAAFNPSPGDLGGHHLLLGYRFVL